MSHSGTNVIAAPTKLSATISMLFGSTIEAGAEAQGKREIAMADRESRAADDLAWSKKVACIAIDTLVAAKIITREQAEQCIEIVAEEIHVRLAIGDRPPGPE
jgi:hypothetical protein